MTWAADGESVPDDEVVAGRLLAILAAIKHLPSDSISLDDDDDFLLRLGMDSIDAVELTLQLDEVFGVEFGTSPDDVDALATFGSLVDLVMARGRTDDVHDRAGAGAPDGRG